MAGRPPKPPDTSTFLGCLGAEIHRRRERRGLSVEEAASLADTPPTTWYRWESGWNFPIDKLPVIAAALGCSPRDLIQAPTRAKRKRS
jgi:transcriptional regulator with XRE-family HTH domain